MRMAGPPKSYASNWLAQYVVGTIVQGTSQARNWVLAGPISTKAARAASCDASPVLPSLDRGFIFCLDVQIAGSP